MHAPLQSATLARQWLMLRRWRRALAWSYAHYRLLWLLRRVRALRCWRHAISVSRVYNNSFRRLYRIVVASKRALVIQSFARMTAPRRFFKQYVAALYTAREVTERQKRIITAAIQMQALLRGSIARRELTREFLRLAHEQRRTTAAVLLQAFFRGASSRRECACRLEMLLEFLIPATIRLQRWWRTVISEKMLRKVRSVVDRYAEAHRLLIAELTSMRAYYDIHRAEAEAELTDAERFLRGDRPCVRRSRDAAIRNEKRFQMLVTLKVGLPSHAKGVPPAFTGSQIFSARSATLRRAGGYFKGFFSNTANVNLCDEDGCYLVERSWKHFDAILDYIRDGSCTLPTAYVPSTYDNRPASTEEQELLEFLREAHFYGLNLLIDQVVPKLLSVKYGCNPRLLELFREEQLL